MSICRRVSTFSKRFLRALKVCSSKVLIVWFPSMHSRDQAFLFQNETIFSKKSIVHCSLGCALLPHFDCRICFLSSFLQNRCSFMKKQQQVPNRSVKGKKNLKSAVAVKAFIHIHDRAFWRRSSSSSDSLHNSMR